MISELLFMELDVFLTFTFPYTFRYMVLMRKLDVIQRLVLAINKTRSEDKSEDVTLKYLMIEHMPGILALLFVQDANDERTIYKNIVDVCPALNSFDLAALIRTDPITTTAEVLKMGALDDLRSKRVSTNTAQNKLVSG